MEKAATLIVDTLIWLGILFIIFTVFIIGFLLKLKDINKEKKRPIDKRER
ncbi:hypothetical protein [Jeotgalibacillus marinus]|uniref:Uncharacterized protein n=1 Tax=Jeotgalibacillus marinus TaxID=86667 RepID=A0ABV3Q4N6_9BACL